ncbi:MAG: adenine-specific methyltransferase EcoRI family protein [Cutibacterium avidum]|nr:adenine-specific methyltransferase EcoRI family protein [Cutibacterium avidum]
MRFSVIGSLNAITYKEIFPLIRDNKLWLGNGFAKGNAYFRVPDAARTDYAEKVYDPDSKTVHFRNVGWYTNIEHGKRHEWLDLDTMERNRTKRKAKAVIRERGYPKYDNYDAIDVAYTEAIPSDHDGAMGVPISFLDKYNPEQFEILGMTDRGNEYGLKTREYTKADSPKANDLNRRGAFRDSSGTLVGTYARILIRHRQPKKD